MAELNIKVENLDDVDVNDAMFFLFGPAGEAAEFGEWLTKQSFTVSRSEAVGAVRRRGRRRKDEDGDV